MSPNSTLGKKLCRVSNKRLFGQHGHFGNYGDNKPVYARKRSPGLRSRKLVCKRLYQQLERPVKDTLSQSVYEGLKKALDEKRNYYYQVDGSIHTVVRFTYSGVSHGILGPMRSCKTEELIRTLKTYSVGGSRVLAAKPGADTRDAHISSRNGLGVETFKFQNILEDSFVAHCIEGRFDIIGIDEGQFVENLSEFVELMCAMGKNVYVCCLDGSFARQMFNPIVSLIPILDTFSKLTAVCSGCPYGRNRPAPFSALREVPDEPIKNSVFIGDSQYASVCRRCYHDYQIKNQSSPKNLIGQ